MALLDSRKVLTREKRNGTLSHYHGTLASILEDSAGETLQQRVRTFSQSTPGEIIYVLEAISAIPGIAVVINGAAGCSASALRFNAGRNVPWYSTNLNEGDTILGGDQKLRSAIQRAYNENHPELIYIIGSPIIAINNDDVESVVREMGEELDCRILYIDVNGFRTKNAVTGYDALYHSLLKNLIEPKQTQSKPFINLVSVSENPRNTAAIADLLGALDIPCNIIPRFSGIRAIRRAGSAAFSVSLNDGENEYLMTGLEESFGVPWLRTNPPVGTAAVYDFVKKAAAKFSPEAAASAGALIEKEQRQARLSLSKKPFAGKRIFLDMDLHLLVGFSSLVDELGGEVSGIAISYLDSGNKEKLKELAFLPPATPVIIAQGQQFEIANLLYKSVPDFYIGKSARAAARLGINALAIDRLLYYGYTGVGETARRAAGADSVYAELLKRKEKKRIFTLMPG